MIDNTTLRRHLGFAFLAVACVIALPACTSDSPTSPPGPGIITPPGETGTVALAWDRPTTDEDGSGPVTDLVGYKVCYGTSRNRLDVCSNVGNVTTAEFELAFGTYYFAVRAVDTWGNESGFSNILQVTIAEPELESAIVEGPDSGAPQVGGTLTYRATDSGNPPKGLQTAGR